MTTAATCVSVSVGDEKKTMSFTVYCLFIYNIYHNFIVQPGQEMFAFVLLVIVIFLFNFRKKAGMTTALY